MRELPKQSRRCLQDVLDSAPSLKPASLSHYTGKRLAYGCDENLATSRWLRYPHEINSLGTCHDLGIYQYFLMQQAGHDVSLVKTENARGTNQDHYDVLFRDSQADYLIALGTFEKIKPDFDGNLEIISDQDIFESIDEINQLGMSAFFESGQQTKKHRVYNKKTGAVYSYHQFLRYSEEFDFPYVSRITHQLPGMFHHTELSVDGSQTLISLSGGVDNSQILDKLPLERRTDLDDGRTQVEHLYGSYEDMNRFKRAISTVGLTFDLMADYNWRKMYSNGINVLFQKYGKKDFSYTEFYSRCLLELTQDDLEVNDWTEEKNIWFDAFPSVRAVANHVKQKFTPYSDIKTPYETFQRIYFGALERDIVKKNFQERRKILGPYPLKPRIVTKEEVAKMPIVEL